MNVMEFFSPMMTFGEELPVPLPALRPQIAKDVADKFVQRYFDTYNYLFPVLDESNFRHAYNLFYEDAGIAINTGQIACVLLVIALGSNTVEVFDAHLHAAFLLYHNLVASPYLPTVQVFILMTLCFMNAGKDGQAILSIAYASHIAQSMGLHRSVHIHRHPRELAFILKDYHLRNRIWWTCYSLDKKLSFENGRPSAIYDDDCDAELPDSTQFSQSSIGLPDGSSFIFLSFFVELAKTVSLISRSLFNRETSGVDNDELLRRIMTADRYLLAWRVSLPEELQPDRELYISSDDLLEVASTLLHCYETACEQEDIIFGCHLSRSLAIIDPFR
ncbi:hypothetical protein NKR23_g7851 [Pleurostoma richardsiae]|uniref:Xylanolytic transcriptional activator regulatory domain-containing protein n=1 Tax=Pleurostoma richardsiae TaxID=41990 RepID=A0AA38VGB5_9PEZI|nr:hypothetical protein NKR23_g7851 [Pleurostoma richardsiae]